MEPHTLIALAQAQAAGPLVPPFVFTLLMLVIVITVLLWGFAAFRNSRCQAPGRA